MDYTILIGGEAGQGIDTTANLLAKILKRHGFYVFSNSDYMSRIRGGHNFIQIRFSDIPLHSHISKNDIILALNKETIEIHRKNLSKTGVIICDKDIPSDGIKEKALALPLLETAKELKNQKIFTTVGLGAILKYFDLDFSIGEKAIKEEFNKDIAELNLQALKRGYALIDAKISLKASEDKNILINGNQSVALGAISAGCKFYCGYPMTPSTGILSFMSYHSNEMGIAVEQVEDEIAALNMALGASYAGVRAMTGSSGGGFALMVEALSLAGMIEVPVVVIDVQRPAPATGFPTRTEQADLQFVIHAGHGEFARMVIALRDVEDAFYQTARAFNIAEKYQIPVLLLSDQHLADSLKTVKPFDFDKITIERHISGEEAITEEEYKRYKITQTGISPRILPGKIPGQIVLVDSDEHDEWGHITESAVIRKSMVEKRLRKFEYLKNEIQEPWFIGKENPENLVIGWGSTYGAIKEAVENLVDEGISVGALIFGDIWPLPTQRLLELSKNAKKIIDIEQNATAQLESLIRQEALIKATHKILKYDGRPFSSDEVYEKIKEVLS
ncbi:2-oxoglutarate ferredoxin oxidoreductase subunit alpha [Thermoanaerobacter uzonensis DSM 18761]|jgi:2-oxoglutarate ferredoxin oxidoreductase subunit alpha|uniref:2-oxoglutarate ferredoxin oxidoreductase subunit alpha n=1 Tax=Thermoanaerobacter uzonensis DSM 18761 TaxID=1123369 RepID=A0A1M4W7P5_9THEO|nr:2-oxoacid:acceptor oxidoreductase subunit alpha [Thermoanaerobacter uzonensis]SHE76992.1 2-oxoglutarate ferredoxin oxidoreductase subunit alpha [Thermoanaerobacter uzonensis DSM 18761]